jgi:hypothetical protein
MPSLIENVLAIGALLLLAWFWLDSLRAREMATGICRTVCKQRDLQFLDQTVALGHLQLKRTDAGLRWRRLYRFDFSEEGIGRRGGYLVLSGLDLETISMGPSERPADP